MRTLYLIILYVGILANIRVKAQCTTGSFGDPVTGSESFGSGSNPGAKLSTEQSNLVYKTNCNLNDTEYTILNSVIGCHTEGWHNVLQDHTPDDVNGYMMVINATDQSSISGTFYYKKIDDLCPNTTYSFSAYVLDLIRKDVDGPNARHPNLTFSIETTSGAILGQSVTGLLESTVTPEFHQYPKPENPLCFTTGNTTTEIILKITNNAPGGNGNDLILDDITFRAMGPPTTAEFSDPSGPPDSPRNICIGNSIIYQLNGNVDDPDYQNYQWQVNANNTGWVDISTTDNTTATSKILSLVVNAPPVGKYQYRLAVAKAGQMASVNCRIYSTPLTINVNPLPVINVDPEIEFCEGETVTVTASGGARHEWNGPGLPPNSPALNIPNATPANSGTYTVRAVSSFGCKSLYAAPVKVTVHPKVNATINAINPICEGGSVQLSASGGSIYKWTPATGLDHDDIPNPTATPAVTTTYSVTVTEGICSEVKPITVTVYKNPKANTPGDKEIFEDESVLLDAHPEGDNV
ncbi:MAG: immunoglobulin domain-containing protein, partial [Sphingobacteriales bacterium]